MTFDPDKILNDLVKIPRIAKQIKKLNLSKEQMLDAIPIFIDMSQQKDDKKTKFLTSFFLNDNGQVQRMEVRSTYWKKFKYLENVKTLNIEKINFEDDKVFFKEKGRHKIIKNVQNYLFKDKYFKGMYLHGAIGSGKTFLLKRIARKLAQNNSVGFINVSNLSIYMKNKFKYYVSLDKTIEILQDVDFLFFDDIGAEQITSWFRDEILLTLLNYRMQNQKTTFFSSNYNFKTLQEVESKTINSKFRDKDKSTRLVSRIIELADEFYLKNINKFKKYQ